jgi:anthranilate/para-aminobenzoate synthase component I
MSIVPHFRPKAIVSRPVTDPKFLNLTPVQFFAGQAQVSDLCWLDSSDQGWSYFAKKPLSYVIVQSDAQIAGLSRRLQPARTLSVPQGSPPFCGGWIGFLAYDKGTALPASRLNFFDAVLAYNHDTKRWWVGMVLLDVAPPEKIALKLAYKESSFHEHFAPEKISQFATDMAPQKCISNYSKNTYCLAVHRVLKYIRDGDIYQLNLAQRFSVAWPAGDLASAELFRRLRQESPAAYGVFMGSALVGNDQAVCSISPELFLRVRGRSVITRPIKGTRPRSDNPSVTAAAARELDSSPKERAELNMIVDVLRHDLGRVCDYGSVKVESAGTVEELPTLLHRVATVSGRLRPRCGPASLLRATFPGGSVTGAPKIRAMQIIRELEPDPRGLYCGSIGWLGVNGDLDLNIAIRTAVHDTQTGTVHYHAGSGIVADSDPECEYDETLQKARAFFRATNATLGEPSEI